MAKKEGESPVKVRVLVDGEYEEKAAKADDVVELSAAAARDHAAQHSVDSDPAAVAYAESLKGLADAPKA